MKVIVAGIARSGTTALYSILQRILTDQPGKVDFIYEPFLWDREVFNDFYEKVSGNFTFLNSVSIEGLYSHLTLPMLIRDPDRNYPEDYLRSLFHHDGPEHHVLVKFIRANGRLSLLKKVCPEAKIIFILRNPLDSVHSILSLFSYFGGEFHRDDYPRFIREVNDFFGMDINPGPEVPQVHKELIYWYYMNRYALMSLNSMPNAALIVNHERYASQPEMVISQICNYLGFNVRESYLVLGRRYEGVVTKKFLISRAEMDYIEPYLDGYHDLLAEFSIDHDFDRESIQKKYFITDTCEFRKNPYYNMNPVMIADDAVKSHLVIERLEKELAFFRGEDKERSENSGK